LDKKNTNAIEIIMTILIQVFLRDCGVGYFSLNEEEIFGFDALDFGGTIYIFLNIELYFKILFID
jgi:hypothetical protein